MSNPFDYLNSINLNKNNMMRDTENDELAEKNYNPYMVNRGLSYFADTVLFANEMNQYYLLDHKMQYEFLLGAVRKKKRFSKWHKSVESEDLEAVKEYYGYSNRKAEQALTVLTDSQLKKIKAKNYKGGT